MLCQRPWRWHNIELTLSQNFAIAFVNPKIVDVSGRSAAAGGICNDFYLMVYRVISVCVGGSASIRVRRAENVSEAQRQWLVALSCVHTAVFSVIRVLSQNTDL